MFSKRFFKFSTFNWKSCWKKSRDTWKSSFFYNSDIKHLIQYSQGLVRVLIVMFLHASVAHFCTVSHNLSRYVILEIRNLIRVLSLEDHASVFFYPSLHEIFWISNVENVITELCFCAKSISTALIRGPFRYPKSLTTCCHIFFFR